MSSPATPDAADSDPPAAVVERLRRAGCVFAEDEAALLVAEAATPAELDALVARRVAGLPLEHVLGWAELCGLRIAVDPGVFVPRRRSELLVQLATTLADPAGRADLDDHGDHADPGDCADRGDPGDPGDPGEHGDPADRGDPGERGDLGDLGDNGDPRDPFAGGGGAARVRARPPVVVDLCCGSGAVGAAVAAGLDRIELHAADIDPAAVRCARRNVAGAGGQVHEGDLYEPLPPGMRGRVDVLVANAPYVPTAEVGLLPVEARLHEPRAALDGGGDGLDIVRRVVAGAPGWLAPGGHLLIETSREQAAEVERAMAGNGLVPRVVTSDELHATVVIGRRRSPATPLPPPG